MPPNVPLDALLMRDAFVLPQTGIYLDGNSLGPLTRRGEARLAEAVAAFGRLGVAAWTESDPPWYTWPEELAAIEARHLLGARPDEVAVGGQTTVNLHQLLATFYRPSGQRSRIVLDALAFPTDRYAVMATLARAGVAETAALAMVASRDGRTLAHEDIVRAIDERTAIVVLPSVLFKSGQLLDLAAITAHAHAVGALVLFDLSHSVGILPHDLDGWGVDLAVWCNYKYLSGGPGTVGGLYVRRGLSGGAPALAGWWGSDKDRQFAMEERLAPAPGAGRFQIGTPPILALAALAGSLELFAQVPIEAIRAASLALTAHLIERADAWLGPLGVEVATPRQGGRRGGHVALAHPQAARLAVALRHSGVVPDFRPPDVLRLCPHPLYTRSADVDDALRILADLIRREAWNEIAGSAAVT